MNRHKRRVTLRSDSKFPHKRDTPVKAAPRRREKFKRLVSSKHNCPTLLEEPEGDEMNDVTVKPGSQVRVSAVPVHRRSVSRLSRPAISEQPTNQAAPSVTPAYKKPGHQKVQQTAYLTHEVTPILKAFEDDDTPGSVISCSTELDSTLNSEEDDDEDADNHSLSSSTSLSSLPSPEIFRKESSVETTFPKKELLSVNLPIKNSTLLESSHAENIHMHHPPDLSNIIGDATTIPAEKNCEISHQKNLEKRSIIQPNSLKPEPVNNSLLRKTSPKPTGRKLILCKKKVWFKSPISTETFRAKRITPSASAARNTSESPGQTKLDPKASQTGESSSKSETSPLLVTLKRPAKTSSVTFFDFGSDNERDAFFQRMRKRSDTLRSFVIFPSRLDTKPSSQSACLL
ncbi:uncharacterized protein LOC108238054 [Kryptolebias marmoratus]|uniref:uncharacterized protein LOC108238054 n=1 Tax=Kryptolebias marmoratus TaxID=37003 RepID=UPI000D530F11|nr:uncharacterized protein LOC108238054 [Kryptolebias marmoratus]